MTRRTGPTNPQTLELISQLSLKARESPFWKRVMEDIEKPTRQRRTINVFKIEQNAKDGETVLIPGKVLSVGTLTKKVNVAALSFSDEAKKKIVQAKGEVLSIGQLLSKNPQGKNVRILG